VIDVKITVTGMKELADALHAYQTEINAIIAKELEKYIQDFLLERIRLNTPIRTGALRRSIGYQAPRVGGARARIVIQSRLPYALRLHEEVFTLGPISAQQPTTEEGGVGNKYISRPARYHVNRTMRTRFTNAVVQDLVKRFPGAHVYARTSRASGRNTATPVVSGTTYNQEL